MRLSSPGTGPWGSREEQALGTGHWALVTNAASPVTCLLPGLLPARPTARPWLGAHAVHSAPHRAPLPRLARRRRGFHPGDLPALWGPFLLPRGPSCRPGGCVTRSADASPGSDMWRVRERLAGILLSTRNGAQTRSLGCRFLGRTTPRWGEGERREENGERGGEFGQRAGMGCGGRSRESDASCGVLTRIFIPKSASENRDLSLDYRSCTWRFLQCLRGGIASSCSAASRWLCSRSYLSRSHLVDQRQFRCHAFRSFPGQVTHHHSSGDGRTTRGKCWWQPSLPLTFRLHLPNENRSPMRTENRFAIIHPACQRRLTWLHTQFDRQLAMTG